MNPIRLVAWYEFTTFVRKPSFLIATVAVPLVAIVVSLALGDSSFGFVSNEGSPEAVEGSAGLPRRGRIGYVDQADFVRVVPPALAGALVAYDDSARAQAALRAGEIDAYYLISSGYLESGAVERVARTFEPVPDDTAAMELLLTANLLRAGDPARLALAREPIAEQLLEHENIGQRAADLAGAEDAEALAFGVAYVLAMLIYTTTFVSASYLLQNVTTEKESRLLEMLLTSIRPVELLAGKVLGLGLLGLMQTVLWAGTAYAVARLGLIEVPLASLGIGWQLGLLLVLYYMLGYGLYAAMMAGIGALVPTVKESGPATMLVVIPAIIPLMFLGALVEQPHGPVAVALSLVPWTAPISMVVRLVQGGVPPWQIALSLLLMAATVPLLLALVARLFRAQTLLASESFSPRRAWAVLREG